MQPDPVVRGRRHPDDDPIPTGPVARAFRHCGADRGAFTTTLVALDAAVDAEARTTGAGT
jgi:hypothetical protein